MKTIVTLVPLLLLATVLACESSGRAERNERLNRVVAECGPTSDWDTHRWSTYWRAVDYAKEDYFEDSFESNLEMLQSGCEAGPDDNCYSTDSDAAKSDSPH